MRSGNIAFYILAAAFTVPSAIYSLTVTSHLISPNVRHKNMHHSQSSKGNTMESLTATYSKSGQTDEFKDINIDDVLMEAENALKIAQTSLIDDDGDVNDKTDGLENQTIDDVLLQAENSLKVAQTSLVDDDGDANKKSGDDELENLKDAIRDSLLSDDIKDKASIEVTEVLSSTLGGILLGSLLGSVATFKLSDFDLLSFGAADFSANAIQFSIPVISGVVLGGIAGFIGSLQENTAGMVVRNVLGVPTRALASAIVSSIQEAARRQVEKTTNEIKSIPSNVANSAKQKAAEKAKEAKLAVDMAFESAVESAVESAIEKIKKLILVLAILSTLVAVGVLIING